MDPVVAGRFGESSGCGVAVAAGALSALAGVGTAAVALAPVSFGPASVTLGAPASSRTTAVEARSWLMRTPGIAISP
jgi:hypothetical protein